MSDAVGDARVGDVRRPILVIGLDGAEPTLVFDRWRQDLPTLDRLMRAGVHARLESTIPAITVPAWASMMTGLDPGQLGLYGFRNRVDRSLRQPRHRQCQVGRQAEASGIVVSAAGGSVGLVSVPQTYPIRPINGDVVSCFLTPSAASEYAHPASLKAEIESWIEGEYLVDVPDFRSEDKARILRDIYRMSEQHYEICRRLLARRRYDYFMTVDMGIDRIQHALWKCMDPGHPKHEPGNPFERAIHDYYVHVDTRIAELLELVPEETIMLVVSDHGAQAMLGGICVNEWLVDTGYLALDTRPVVRTAMEAAGVAWGATRAWGEGGYYGRVTLNVAGREPSRYRPSGAPRSRADGAGDALGGHHRSGRPAAGLGRLPPGGDLPRGAQRGAGPARVFRAPDLALGRQRRHGRGLDIRERPGARRCEPLAVRHHASSMIPVTLEAGDALPISGSTTWRRPSSNGSTCPCRAAFAVGPWSSRHDDRFHGLVHRAVRQRQVDHRPNLG